jgi:4a-hydroxytetrahydrobiopterin dehydratase
MSKGTDLAGKKCVPCANRGIPALGPEEVGRYLQEVPAWRLTPDGLRIAREWRVKDFQSALDFFSEVGKLAEEEGHHPDLHLTRYRQVAIELWTHAANGLTLNDFVLAAKIDRLPVELQK